MKQLPLAGLPHDDRPCGEPVVLEPTMIEALVPLMAKAMIAVVRRAAPTPEDADEC